MENQPPVSMLPPESAANGAFEESFNILELQTHLIKQFEEKANNILLELNQVKNNMAIKSGGGSPSQGTTDEPQAKRVKQGDSSRDKNYTNLQDESEHELHSDQDDSISLHPTDNEFSEGEDEEFQSYVNPPMEEDLIDDVEDPILKDLMDSIDDDLGPDIDPKLATVLLNIWGKSKFSERQKKDFKKIKVPGNAKFLTTPLLNPEIYNILYDSSIQKDKAAQRRQRMIVKAATPILQALQALRKSQTDLHTLAKSHAKKHANIASEISNMAKQITEISPLIRNSIKVLNASYSDALRKRKSDICKSLGKQFGGFTTCESSIKQLFDDASIKKMKPYIRSLNEKSKNSKWPRKSYGSRKYKGNKSQSKGKGDNHGKSSHYKGKGKDKFWQDQ